MASSLLETGHEVTVVDMEGDRLSVQEAFGRIVASSPEMVAFGGMVTRFRYVKELTKLVRNRLPGVFTTAGNSGASTVPEVYLKSCEMDCVVLGEGEITAVELAGALERGADWKQVSGLAWLDSDGVLQKSSPREPIADLDSIPWPARDLMSGGPPIARVVPPLVKPVRTIILYRGKRKRKI